MWIWPGKSNGTWVQQGKNIDHWTQRGRTCGDLTREIYLAHGRSKGKTLTTGSRWHTRKIYWHMGAAREKHWTLKADEKRLVGIWPGKSNGTWVQQGKNTDHVRGGTPTTKSRWDRICGHLTPEIYLAHGRSKGKTLTTKSRLDRTCGGLTW